MTTGSGANAPSELVDRDYKTSTVAWEGGGHVLFLTKVSEHEGKLKICGAYGPANARGAAATRSREVADSVILQLDWVRVAHGLGFMASHDGARAPVGQPANCRVTGMEWRAEFAEAATYIELSRTVF